ncbi:hypothetical protein C922_05224 [Plasmodium inui San Antonio 1]|uniref:Uncharacterized protein n=1 Tax=Plasmodium inui San Antonio 1 TaxID=1237626 RepID=W6ZYI2_9APIC|nr:hypothetical protein C922_05224 [Plasmodium inui San Antonio 1]EUD64403.1 hypothetical protein C922_05224 [Plasmodium inui San Antonio 1]
MDTNDKQEKEEEVVSGTVATVFGLTDTRKTKIQLTVPLLKGVYTTQKTQNYKKRKRPSISKTPKPDMTKQNNTKKTPNE